MISSNARIRDVGIGKDVLKVDLADGRTVIVPLAWYPSLLHASEREKRAWKTCAAGTGIYWPLLDYHLSAQGLLEGLPEAPGIREGRFTLQEA